MTDDQPHCPEKWNDDIFQMLDYAEKKYGDMVFFIADLERCLPKEGRFFGNISRQNISYHIKKLHQLGVLSVEVSDNDRRQRLLKITARGKQCLECKRRRNNGETYKPTLEQKQKGCIFA